MFKLFQQNPKQEKFEVDSSIRIIESIDMDRKEDLVKFKKFMQGVSTETSDLPDKEELDKLHDEATKARGTSFGILGIVAAIGAGGLGFHFLGGFGGISKLVSDAMSFISGGGVKTSTGEGDNILGLSGTEVESLIPKVPNLSGPSTALSPQTKTQPLPQVTQPPASTPITPYNEPPVSGQPYNPNSSPRKSTTEPPDPVPPTNQSRSSKTTQNQVSTGTGGVVQWLHGTPGRPGYDAGHAGSNAHDHFSFNSRASAVAAFKALKAEGFEPYEFEGYGKYTRQGMKPGSHSPGGGHFGPVGGTPTYNDLTDGTAFDIPWSSYGSGPITQSDYDKSLRAAQIVGAVGGGGANNTGATPEPQTQSSSTTPPPAPPNTPQQQQPNIIQRLTKMLEPYTSQVTSQLGQVFEAFKYMQDKELMDNTILYRDVMTGEVELPIKKEEEVEPPKLEYGLESILEMIKPTPKDTEVSMLSPEAEQALGGMVILNNQGMPQGGGGASTPGASLSPEDATTIGTAENPVMILGGSFSTHDLHKKQMYRKLGSR